MGVAAVRDERGLVAVALHGREAEDVTVEGERAVDVAHREVDVADVDARIDRHSLRVQRPRPESASRWRASGQAGRARAPVVRGLAATSPARGPRAWRV